MSMNNFENTASVETSRFLALFIMKLNGLIIKKHIVYAVSVKKAIPIITITTTVITFNNEFNLRSNTENAKCAWCAVKRHKSY